MKRLIVFLIIILLSLTTINSQNQATLTTNINKATIGDQIKIRILIKSNQLLNSIIFNLDKSKDFEIIKQNKFKTKELTNEFIYEKQIIIAFFKTGKFKIGPYNIKIKDNNNNEKVLTTNFEIILIESVLEENDKDIKPITSPIEIKGNPYHVLKYIIFFLLLLMLIILLIKYFKYKKSIEIRNIPELSPIEEFEKNYNKIINKNYLKKEKYKDFFVIFSSIFKHFIQRYYKFNAEDMTSYEILTQLYSKERDSNISDEYNKIFKLADLIKFAKYKPQEPEISDILTSIENLIAKYKKIEKEKLENSEEKNDIGK